MASLTATSRTLLRSLPRASSLPARAFSTSAINCRASATDSSFDSPFRGDGGDSNSKIPDFSKYRSKQGSNSNLVFQYFMVGEWRLRSHRPEQNTDTEARNHGCPYCCWSEGYCSGYVK